MNNHVFNVFACLLGSGMLIFSKEVAEGARRFQVLVSGRDYGASSLPHTVHCRWNHFRGAQHRDLVNG
jgi:hypothetical protein